MEDNKTEYIAPLTFSTRDLVDIQQQNKEAFLSNTPEQVGIHEFVYEMYEKNKSYNNSLISFAEKVNKIREGNFFIEVIPNKDAIADVLWIQNIKCQLFDRKTIPTPTPGHHVHFYDAKTQHISFVWALPNQACIDFIKYNIVELSSDLKELIEFVYEYEDGTLMQRAQKISGDTYNKSDGRTLKLHGLTPQTDTVLKDNKIKE